MAALPYIQLYVADYLADTMHLSTEEHGAYLLLIMNYWQTGKPIKEKHIQAITKVSNERLTDVINSLQHFFNVDETNGIWTHYRIEKDLEKVRCKSIKASESGKKSAKKRWVDNINITNAITDVTKTLQRNCNHTEAEAEAYTNIKDISLSNDKEIVDTEVPTIEDGGEKNDKSESFSGEPGKPVGKKPKSPPCPYEKIKELYHNVLPSLPTIQSLSDKRKGHIRNLWRRQLKSLVEWENYFKHVSNSDFLMGKTSHRDRAPFNCTIDFLINENNFLKISEMKYHGNRLQQRK